MVEPRNPFMGQSGRQGYSGRPRTQLPNRQTRPGTIEVPKHEHEEPPVRAQSKPARNDSLLEALIKLMNSFLRFKGK
ncbi:MAG TPA: hypothetical protein VFF14_08220 [Candidatus Deferrimicrobium sp.]|nr:hypothetical protein [Candidatus Deferrimicrobium sp.]